MTDSIDRLRHAPRPALGATEIRDGAAPAGDRQQTRAGRSRRATWWLTLLALWLIVAPVALLHPSVVRAQEDDSDLFEELDRAADAVDSEGEDDEEEDEDEVDGYNFDDPKSLGYGVEELVVTGKASEATAQAIPDAITEFSQGDLDTMGISDVSALSLNTPSLHVGNFGAQPVITLRGVGAANLTTVGTPGVGFEMDGIHQGRPTAAAVRIYDVENVRVYRGPQGIDGGYNTNGGRISVTSQRPTEELDVIGDIQYGAYDQILVRGALNVPVLPDGLLMTRATVTYENRDGYQENKLYDIRNLDASDADDLITRFQTRSLFADESVEVRLIGGYNYQKGIGPSRHLLDENLAGTSVLVNPPPGQTTMPWKLERLIIPGCTNEAPTFCKSDDPRVTYADDVGYQDNVQGSLTATVDWDMPYFANNGWFSDLHVGVIGGFVRTDRASRLDVDGTNIPNAYFEQQLVADQGSVEAFIERPDVERFDFKTGGFFFDETVASEQCLDTLSATATNDVYSDQDLKNRSLAWYGNAGYRVLDNLRVDAGLRYSNEQKSAEQINLRYSNLPPGGNNPPTRLNDSPCGTFFQQFLDRNGPQNQNYISTDALTGEFTQTGTTTFSAWTYEAGADWDVTDSNSISFGFTTGYKPGGFTLGTNPDIVISDTAGIYGAEEVTQYELTSKNLLFEGKLSANLTVFWTDYDPFQVCQIIGVQFECNTDGSATSRGIELEMVATPIDGLTLNGHFNYLDARVQNLFLRDPTYRDPNAPQVRNLGGPPEDLSGNTLEKAPRFAGSFGAQYDWDLEQYGILTPRAQVQTQSRTYYRVFNEPRFSQPAFAKLDLSLEWQSEDGIYFVRGFVDNVTDVDVINFLFVAPSQIGAPVLGFYLPPRTWGIRVGINALPNFF